MDDHCGDDNCLCHGDRRHRTGWCEPPFPVEEEGLEWTCPECGEVSVSFRVSELGENTLRVLLNNDLDPANMFGWRRT